MNQTTASQPFLRALPWSLVFLRLGLAPVIVWAAKVGLPGYMLSGIVLVALLSDIYDGVIARKLQCDTPAIRVSDSLVDTVFYLGVLAALWTTKPHVVRVEWPLLAAVLTLEGIRYIVDLKKFGKSASYHSYLAKAWGLTMAISLIAVFALDFGVELLALALVLGVLCDIEGLIISAILPRWKVDVKTIPRALGFRREMLAGDQLARLP